MRFYLTQPQAKEYFIFHMIKNKNYDLRFHSCPEKKHLRAVIAACNQTQVFFPTEQMSHLQASDETTGFLIWHLMCQQVVNESQSPGWQLYQHGHPL